MTNSKFILKKGDLVEVTTVDGTIKKGSIECFEERTVVISAGVDRFLVRKKDLEKQNYVIPEYKRIYKTSI